MLGTVAKSVALAGEVVPRAYGTPYPGPIPTIPDDLPSWPISAPQSRAVHEDQRDCLVVVQSGPSRTDAFESLVQTVRAIDQNLLVPDARIVTVGHFSVTTLVLRHSVDPGCLPAIAQRLRTITDHVSPGAGRPATTQAASLLLKLRCEPDTMTDVLRVLADPRYRLMVTSLTANTTTYFRGADLLVDPDGGYEEHITRMRFWLAIPADGVKYAEEIERRLASSSRLVSRPEHVRLTFKS